MHPVTPPGSAEPGGLDAPSADEVRAHLAVLLASSAFRTSKRGARFLEFTVNEVLAGRAATLKERTLAIEVFDRAPSWDAGDDTIVRVGAREVRKRLAQFYAMPEAAGERMRIELPLGSYVPEFVWVSDGSGIQPTAPQVAVVGTDPVRSMQPVANRPGEIVVRRKWRPVAVSLVILAAVLLVGWRVFSLRVNSPFDTFWAPFYQATEPVLVAVAHPLVYSPSPHAYALNSARSPTDVPALSANKPLNLPPSALNGSDFLPEPDKYLAFGDAVASTAVQMLLAKHNRETHLRFASRVQFADLRDAPTVFIGAFSNHWTVELTGHYRYHFGFDSKWVPGLLDYADPQQPKSVAAPDASSDEYFLICRIPNSPTGSLMVFAAGVAEFGTEAAGRFLGSADLMDPILRALPKDWATRNLELVMRARVIGDSPAKPELVSSYLW